MLLAEHWAAWVERRSLDFGLLRVHVTEDVEEEEEEKKKYAARDGHDAPDDRAVGEVVLQLLVAAVALFGQVLAAHMCIRALCNLQIRNVRQAFGTKCSRNIKF